MVRIPRKHSNLGSEHPFCHKIQLTMTILFFVVWLMDYLSQSIFGCSTILTGLKSLPILIILAIISLGSGLYLIVKSHTSVFGKETKSPRLIDFGVYSLVRHPMYLGILLLFLSCFFFIPSLLSLVIWILFFIVYDKMATFEESDLVRKIGKKYVNYQNKVPKWFPKIWK